MFRKADSPSSEKKSQRVRLHSLAMVLGVLRFRSHGPVHEVSGVSVLAFFLLSGLCKLVPVVFPDVLPLDSDEAVLGLMARHMAKGDFPLFYYGQTYGGGFEVLLAGALQRVLPSGVYVIRLAAAILAFATECLFYRALTPSFSSRAPRIAATAMLTLGGMTYARFVSHLYGMHLNNSFLFALLLYWFARVDRLPRRIFLVGLGLGVGYWVSDFVWVLLACVLAAQLQVWRVLRNLTLRSLLLCVLGFTVGALPRIIHSYSPEDWYAPYRAGGFALVRVSAIPRRVLDLAFATLPAYFFGELRSMRTIGSFLLIVGAGLTVLILTFAAVPISREWRQGKSSAFVPACVFLLAALACVLVVLNRKVFDSGYRYLWPMQFAVAVAFAKAMDCMEKWRSFRGHLRTLCRVCLALPCLLGALALFRAQQADAHLSLSTKMRSLAAQALSNGCRVGVADYWYAYGPSYFTREQLRLDPIYTSRILSYSRSASLAIAAGTRYCAILDLSDHAQVTELNRRLYERLQAQASRIYHYPGSIVLLVLGADPVEGV